MHTGTHTHIICMYVYLVCTHTHLICMYIYLVCTHTHTHKPQNIITHLRVRADHGSYQTDCTQTSPDQEEPLLFSGPARFTEEVASEMVLGRGG